MPPILLLEWLSSSLSGIPSEELYDLILGKLRSKIRIKHGQQPRASMGIMGSQTVRWGNNRSFKSSDSNKKIKGVEHHVVVDKNGFLLAVIVRVVHTHANKAVLLLMRVLNECFHNIKVIISGGGYCDKIVEVREKFGYLLQIVLQKTAHEKSFKPVHKRWIAERTFAWFDSDRRLCCNYELLMEPALKKE